MSSSLANLRVDVLPFDVEPLYRIWSVPGADWEPKNTGIGRVDCPIRPAVYSVLYMASTPLVAVQETFLLTFAPDSQQWIFHRERAEAYSITSYRTGQPLRAVSLDEPNASLLGLRDDAFLDPDAPFQKAAYEIWSEAPSSIGGLYWRSKHREASGLALGVFADRKLAAGLMRTETMKLTDHPVVEKILRSKVVVLR